MTVDQLADYLSDIGEGLPQDLNQAMLNAADIVIQEIKSNPNFPVNSGQLRNSLQARVTDGVFGITMRDYGYYQNYGVKGTQNTRSQRAVPDIVRAILPPTSGDTYAFNPQNKMIGGELPFGVRVAIHQRGLNAKNFIDFEQVAIRLEELINQNFNIQ